MNDALQPERVALLPWGGVIEDLLDPIGVTLEGFAREMTGGWLFGYADALRAAGMEPSIVCFASAVRAPTRLVNPASGVVTVALPPSPLYRALLRWRGPPVAGSGAGGASAPTGWGQRARDAAGYLSTPPGTLGRALRAGRCGTLLAQEYDQPRFDVASAVARRLGAGVFATFQGGPAGTGAIVLSLRRASIRRADGLVIAAGEEAARVVREHGVAEDRIARIPNPLDLGLWHPEPRVDCRRALDLPDEARIAVCHTRVEWHRKGLDVLLAAWRQVLARHRQADLRLHLIGSGPDDARLEAELGRAPVRGLLWTRRYLNDRAEMRRALSAADVHVLASRREGFPVAPLEAMACGLPTVLADASGAADILADGERSGGILVPREDATALAAALERILFDDPLRARLGHAARRRVEGYASTGVVGRRLAEFLHRRLAARGRGGSLDTGGAER